eukprot:5137-Pelagococcus_subviridis.AAC.2
MHGRHRGCDVSPSRVPLDVRRHEVLRARHRLHLVDVEELKLAVHRLQAREDDRLALRRPEEVVRGLVLQRADELNLIDRGGVVDHGVKRDVGPRAVAVDDREPMALGLPRERDDLLVLVRELENLHGAIRLFHAEQLEPAVRRLFRLGVSVHLHREVIAALLPEHLDVGDAEEVLASDLLLARDGDERDARGLVPAAALGLKHGEDRIRGGPAKVDHALELDGLLPEQRHVRRGVHGHRVVPHAREERALGGRARPLEDGPREPASGPRRVDDEIADGALKVSKLGARARVEKVNHHGGVAPALVRGPAREVPLARRELDELHAVVRKLLVPLPRRAAPQRDALPMHRRQKVPSRRPLRCVRRGGVERRQMELKCVEVCRD